MVDRFVCKKRPLSGGGNGAVLVELAGVVDPLSLASFRAALTDAAAGASRLALDCSHLRYLASEAIEHLLDIASGLREGGGDLALIRVPPKVRAVVESLGHADFFREVCDESAAAKCLGGEGYEPAYVRVLVRGDAGGRKSSRREDAAAKEEASPEESAKEQTKSIIACGSCHTKLAVLGQGTYRCPKCKSLLAVKEDFSVDTFPEKDKTVTEITLPPKQEYVESLRALLSLAASDAGIDGGRLQQMVKALECCSLYLLEKALSVEGAEKEKLHLLIESEPKVLRVLIYAAGKQLDLDDNLVSVKGLETAAANTDLFRFSRKGGGNLFTLERRAD